MGLLNDADKVGEAMRDKREADKLEEKRKEEAKEQAKKDAQQHEENKKQGML